MKVIDRPGQHLVIGVDEAGRGPVLGPLVVGGFACPADLDLKALGVKDSKQLSPRRREQLFERLQGLGLCAHVSLAADDLDLLRDQMTLNRIEARLFAGVLKELWQGLRQAGHPSRGEVALSIGAADQPTAYLDAADANARAFGREVQARLTVALGEVPALTLVSEHKADSRYPVVGAASILAKVTRDRAIQELAARVGRPVGSGYPADRVTQAFIKEYLSATGRLPPEVRHSWKTVANLLRPQTSLEDHSPRTQASRDDEKPDR